MLDSYCIFLLYKTHSPPKNGGGKSVRLMERRQQFRPHWPHEGERRKGPGEPSRTIATLPPPPHGVSTGEIASFWESSEASQLLSP